MTFLPRREATIVKLRRQGWTYQQIADLYGTTKEHARQLHATAQERIRVVKAGQPNSPEFFYAHERFTDGNATLSAAKHRKTIGI